MHQFMQENGLISVVMKGGDSGPTSLQNTRDQEFRLQWACLLREQVKSLKVSQVFGVIIFHATFFSPDPTMFVVHLVFFFTVCWKKRLQSWLVLFCFVFFKEGFIMGAPLAP